MVSSSTDRSESRRTSLNDTDSSSMNSAANPTLLNPQHADDNSLSDLSGSVYSQSGRESPSNTGIPASPSRSSEPLSPLLPPARPKRFESLLQKQRYKMSLDQFKNSVSMGLEEKLQRDVENPHRYQHRLVKLCGDLVNHTHYPNRAVQVQELLQHVKHPDNFKTTKRRTALHHAVRTRRGRDSVDVVELLISAGANVNIFDR